MQLKKETEHIYQQAILINVYMETAQIQCYLISPHLITCDNTATP